MIKQCEIEPVDCSECSNDQQACAMCIHQKSDMFIPKRNELDKLFIGAPVVIQASGIVGTPRLKDGMVLTTFHNSLGSVLRLPTIEESPRNVWLAPWLEMPDYENSILVRYKSGGVMQYEMLPDFVIMDWDKVEAIMILGKLKYA